MKTIHLLLTSVFLLRIDTAIAQEYPVPVSEKNEK